MAFTSALPDDFIASYISTKYPSLMEKTRTEKLQFDQLISRTSQRGPQGEETPSLWNEAKYLYNIIWTLTNWMVVTRRASVSEFRKGPFLKADEFFHYINYYRQS